MDRSNYIIPIGNDGEDVTYIVYETLITMCTRPFKDMFIAMREKAMKKQPDGRWAAEVFREVQSYLSAEVENPASHHLTRRERELAQLHAQKHSQLRSSS